MIKKFWQRLTRKRQGNEKLTRKEQVLSELGRGVGTARQVADRTGLKLNLVRVNMSALHKAGLGTQSHNMATIRPHFAKPALQSGTSLESVGGANSKLF